MSAFTEAMEAADRNEIDKASAIQSLLETALSDLYNAVANHVPEEAIDKAHIKEVASAIYNAEALLMDLNPNFTRVFKP